MGTSFEPTLDRRGGPKCFDDYVSLVIGRTRVCGLGSQLGSRAEDNPLGSQRMGPNPPT